MKRWLTGAMAWALVTAGALELHGDAGGPPRPEISYQTVTATVKSITIGGKPVKASDPRVLPLPAGGLCLIADPQGVVLGTCSGGTDRIARFKP